MDRLSRPESTSHITDNEHLNRSVSRLPVDQAFAESRAQEIIWLFGQIGGTGAIYDEDMLLNQRRFGAQFDNMWEHSHAIVDNQSGEILNVLFACVLDVGMHFKNRIREISGQEIGNQRLYISELVTRPGEATRDKGYASRALEHALTNAHEAGIDIATLVTELSEQNRAALDFYEKRGFSPYGFQDYIPPLPEGEGTVSLYRMIDESILLS